MAYLPPDLASQIDSRRGTNGILVETEYKKEYGSSSIHTQNDDFYFHLVKQENGNYCVESCQSSLDFCLENGIISSYLEDEGDYAGPYPVYKVKFNNLLDLDFGNIPNDITRYFRKLEQNNDMEFQKLFILTTNN